MRVIGFFDSIRRDLRFAMRGVSRRPAFMCAAVLTLALGIGATTAIFSVVYGVLIKPLPYGHADELVSIRHTAPGSLGGRAGDASLGSGVSLYVTYREENRSFENIGLWTASERTVTGWGEPERIRTVSVTQGTLQSLGVQPVLGRWFTDDEHTTGADGPDPVILSYAFWQRRFSGDESALGRALSLDGSPSQVVGIMPAGFRFLSLAPQPDAIIAMRTELSTLKLDNLNYWGLARLKHGVTLAQANADLARMLPIWLDAWPARPGFRETMIDWRVAPALRPLRDDVVGGVAGMLWLLMGTVGVVLLIACANIANLLLVRGDARRQELAIRAALGAGRQRIAGELLAESLVLGAVGGVVGLALAFFGLKLLAAYAPANLPRVEDIGVGLPVLAFAVVSALASSAAFGSIPAVKYAFASYALLGAAARGTSASRERNRTRSALIVVQVALALVLLVGAGLMIRTFFLATTIDPGFSNPRNVQIAQVFIPPAVMLDPDRYHRAYRDILEQIVAVPGVTAAGWGGVPTRGGSIPGAISVEDRSDLVELAPGVGGFMDVSPGYFEALGARVVAGRGLTWPDVDERRKVALVSENLARELWDSPQAAIGKRLRKAGSDPGAWSEIVGVTADVYHFGPFARPPPVVYWPATLEGSNLRAITYLIRSERAGTESLVKELRQAVQASHPDLAVFGVTTLKDVFSEALSRTSFMLVLLATAGAMALLLSIVGIYGVMAYVFSQRTREIGIRLALGAQPAALKRIFVIHGLALVALGIAVGLVASVALTRLMTSFLFGVSVFDATTYLVALGVLVTAAALASYLPARRAANVDPIETLRAE